MSVFKNPNDLADSINSKFKFNYPNSLEEINNALNNGSLDEIELGDGYFLSPRKDNVYGDERDYNLEFDVTYGDDILDTIGVYGLDFDEDYQSQLQDIINNHKTVDADYERSYGPVDTPEKYQAYLKWLKEGN